MYTISLQLLKNCNLRCKYCFVDHSSDVMDIETGKKAIDFEIARALKMKQKEATVTFFGGEPLIKFEMIKELTAYTKSIVKDTDLKVTFDLVTNGILFTDEVSRFFIENNFSVGISLDGTERSHDLNRIDISGRPTYSRILDNLGNIKNYEKVTGKFAQVSMVIAKNNYKDFYENFKSIIDLGFRKVVISIEDYGYGTNEAWTHEDFTVIEQGFRKAAQLYLDKAESGAPFMWNMIDGEIEKLIKPSKNYFCGCGIINNFVTTDGSIYPCTFCTKDSAKIGHIDSGIYKDDVKPFLKYERKLPKECQECSIKEFCSSCDCLMKNLENCDDLYKVSFKSCEFAKLKYRINKELLDSERWNKVMARYGRAVN